MAQVPEDITENDFVSLRRSEYTELLEARDMLAALESAGVDNWEGYEEALALRNESVS